MLRRVNKVIRVELSFSFPHRCFFRVLIQHWKKKSGSFLFWKKELFFPVGTAPKIFFFFQKWLSIFFYSRFNSIQALSETSFTGLTKLELLMIHGNDIPSIPDGALGDLISLQVNQAWWFPRWFSGKESACQCMRHCFDPWVGKIPWGKKWQPTPVFLPGESHGQGNLVGCSPWGHRVGHNLATKTNQTGHIWPALIATSTTSRGEGKL